MEFCQHLKAVNNALTSAVESWYLNQIFLSISVLVGVLNTVTKETLNKISNEIFTNSEK